MRSLRHFRTLTRSRVLAAGTCTILAAGLLAACGSGDDAPEDSAATSATSLPAPETSEADSADKSAGASESQASESASASETTSRQRVTRSRAAGASASEEAPRSAEPSSARGEKAGQEVEINEEVEEAFETFQALVPRSLFAQFSECSPAGLDDSYNCTGPGVGQVQFFKSESKATQTTQVLTELRSSRVLEDDGNRIVGWSTLGTTAVLTVVDNELGMVMQQMISTDQEDPEEKLEQMGVFRT